MNREKDDPGQNDLFPFELINASAGEGTIDVNHMRYMGNQAIEWGEAFKGFQHLKILTFSYSLEFITGLLERFKFADCEIIIGFRNLVNLDTVELLLSEYTNTVNDVVEYFGRHSTLKERVEKGALRIYIVRHGFRVHSKTYMLKADDGKTRVLNGSANATYNGWANGDQLESYNLCDDPEFYVKEVNSFNLLRDNECDPIDLLEAKKIQKDGSNLGDLPAFKNILNTRGALVLDNKPEENIDYVFPPEAMKKILRDADIRPGRDGKVLINAEKVKTIISTGRMMNNEDAPVEQRLPELFLNWYDGSVILNGKRLSLDPEKEQVCSDIQCWLDYMKGFGSFTGDTVKLKTSAWKILNHMFVSPFFAMMRYQDRKISETSSGRHFPIYMLIIGPRDNGKSTLVSFIQKMMLGFMPETLHNDDFSLKNIQGLSQNVKGIPILFDDVNPKKWGHACKEMVKEDAFLSKKEKFSNHPTFVMTTNGVNVPAEVVKRCVVIRLDNQLTSDDAAINERPMAKKQRKIGNAFYMEYLSLMFPKAIKMVSRLNSFDGDDSELDMYHISAEVLENLLIQYGFEIPEELQLFTWADYMGEETISESAIEEVKRLYQAEPTRFSVNRKENLLRIDFSDHTEKDKIIMRLNDGLPATSEKHAGGSTISMRLDVMEKRCGIKFKNGGWRWNR